MTQNSRFHAAAGVVIGSIALLLSLFAMGLAFNAGSSQNAGGQVENFPSFFPNGIHLGLMANYSNVESSAVIELAKSGGTNGTLLGSNVGIWTNNTGRVVHVKTGGTIWTDGTASSSMNFFIGTSTVTTVTDCFTINCTPTVGATPWSYFKNVGTVYQGMLATGTPASVAGTATTSIDVPVGANLEFVMESAVACTAVGSCETATSSNRGFNAFLRFGYFYAN